MKFAHNCLIGFALMLGAVHVNAQPVEGLMLREAVKQHPQFQQEVKSAFLLGDIDYATMMAGPQAPKADIQLTSGTYAVYDACEAHNCADNAVFLFVKLNPKRQPQLESVIHIKECSFNQLGLQDVEMQHHVANLLGRTELETCKYSMYSTSNDELI